MYALKMRMNVIGEIIEDHSALIWLGLGGLLMCFGATVIFGLAGSFMAVGAMCLTLSIVGAVNAAVSSIDGPYEDSPRDTYNILIEAVDAIEQSDVGRCEDCERDQVTVGNAINRLLAHRHIYRSVAAASPE